MALNINKVFGKVLRRLRLEAEMSQEKLAFEAGLQRVYISKLELAEYQPTITTLHKLSMALDIKISTLFQLVENELENKDNDDTHDLR